MSLYGVLRTGVSGMNAQATKLGTVADNIANVNTNGYKRAGTEFSSLILPSEKASYQSGGVSSNIRYAISEQGSLQFTTSATDVAIDGAGFLVVTDPDGTPFLTRAGSFVPDGDGNLVNAAGFTLVGVPLTTGDATVTANALTGLVPVTVRGLPLDAAASTAGIFQANMPANADIVAPADLPSANAATAEFTAKTSLVAYDSLGNEVFLDVYFSKTAAETWEMAVFDKAEEDAAGGFPYAAGPLATDTFTFDATTGDFDGASPTSLTVPVPGGDNLVIDMTGTVQLGTDYMVLDVSVNGNAPSAVSELEIDEDGTVFSIMEDGSRRASFRIPLADLISPDNLTPLPGNVYSVSSESGGVRVGLPGEAGFGRVLSGALEQSNADMGNELVAMIESQRSYTANSKVFQTGAELLDVLINLKR